MGDEDARGNEEVGALRKRRAALPDGRYLIYFTFDAGGEEPPAAEERARPEPGARAESAEEWRV